MLALSLRSFKRKVKTTKRAMRSFLTKTENNPPRKLDDMMVEIDREVWAETSCLSCANCCKSMSPTYTPKDIRRISSHFQMTPLQFKDKWLYLDKKDWMNVKRPCQFLDLTTNMCTIYEIRPADCAGFPHFLKRKTTEYMHVHRQNIEYCPATYKMVEKLKERVLLSKIQVKKIEISEL